MLGTFLNAINQTAFTDLSDTLTTLIIALIPVIIIIGVFGYLMHKIKFEGN
jgi:hypothetical protein